MTPLLSFANVGKSYPDGNRRMTVLADVSFDIESGVFAGLYGSRRCGKSTLLRLAAGIEPPDTGIVSFDGRALASLSVAERGRLLRRDVALMTSDDWRPNLGESVADHVATSLGSEGLTVREARTRSFEALERVGLAAKVAEEPAGLLSLTERTLVMLARAVVREPRLMLVDEPAVMPSPSERDKFYALLRSLAQELEAALLVVSEEMSAVGGAGMKMSLSGGEVRTTDPQGTVVQLRTRNVAGAERHPQVSELQLRNVVKHYPSGGGETIRAVDGISLTVSAGELVALYGPSGSGKTTLLLLAASLLTPESGSVLFGGRDIGRLSERESAHYRLHDVGFVFQSFHLMPNTSALDNTTIKLTGDGFRLGEARRLALPWLERLGLGGRADHTPEQLSMGERQRVAIARALVNEPRLLLADEPTGNLDSKRSRETLALLRDICHEHNIPGLLVTHDPDAMSVADRVHTLRDGQLADVASIDTTAVAR